MHARLLTEVPDGQNASKLKKWLLNRASREAGGDDADRSNQRVCAHTASPLHRAHPRAKRQPSRSSQRQKKERRRHRHFFYFRPCFLFFMLMANMSNRRHVEQTTCRTDVTRNNATSLCWNRGGGEMYLSVVRDWVKYLFLQQQQQQQQS